MKGTISRGMSAVLLALGLITSAARAQTVEYVHTDALGSVVAITDSAGQVTERREYEPYGSQLTPAVEDGPGYTGHVQDASTGLTYMQQRYYDPAIGAFLSNDPVSALEEPVEMFNRYRYASGNPYALVDPDGRSPRDKQTGTRIRGGGAGNNVVVVQVNSAGGRSGSGEGASLQADSAQGATLAFQGLASGSGCMGGADCDFIYNQNQFLNGSIGSDEFSARTQAQGAGGMVGAALGASLYGGGIAWGSALRMDLMRFGSTMVPNQLVHGPGAAGITRTWAIKGGGGRFSFHYHVHRYNWNKPWVWFKQTPVIKPAK